MLTSISVINGDITKTEADAIVCPSNLLYEVGLVYKAVVAKGGIELKKGIAQILETRHGKPIDPGEAVITKSYNLPSKYVIFTSGVFWNGGNASEKVYLYNCYTNSLNLALQYQLKSIAFPLIGTGVDQVPRVIAEEIALRAFKDFTYKYPDRLEKIILVKYL